MKKAKKIICFLLCCTSMLMLTACSDEEKLLSVLLATEIFGEKTVSQALYIGDAANKIGNKLGILSDKSVDFNYDDGYKDGVVSKNCYENEYFNLKFTFPKDYASMPIGEDRQDNTIKTEAVIGHKSINNGKEFQDVTVEFLVTQLPDDLSDEQIKKDLKKSASEDGFTYMSGGTATIAGESYIFNESILIEDNLNLTIKRYDRRKNNKLLSIMVYYPVGNEAKIGSAFSRLK